MAQEIIPCNPTEKYLQVLQGYVMLVKALRVHQRSYFSTRSQDSLKEAKKCERQLDVYTEQADIAIRELKKLFPSELPSQMGIYTTIFGRSL